MSQMLELRVVRRHGTEPLRMEVEWLWNGGWAGRDQAEVQKHAAELAAHGIPGPTTVPIYFPLANYLATTADAIQVIGPESSGEVEYALFFTAQGTYVGVASDHTDRAFEVHGIQQSKQLCPNILAPEVWPLEEVRDHWDALELRCWVTQGGRRRLYQDVRLEALLSVDQWLAILEPAGIARPGTVFLSGAPPTLEGLVFGERYEIELRDPVLDRALRHSYSVTVLPRGVQ